jgi:prolyl 4-hydroxylase
VRSREHISFRREATFKAEPHALAEPILDDVDVAVRREDMATGVYLLHGLMTVKECKRLITAAEARGFSHAGLAVGDDTYRVNLAARNNERVVLDAPALAAGLWPRLQHLVDPTHDGAPVRAVNTRFRVYRYGPGQRFAPHVDVRTKVPGGETRYSLMVYLSDEFTAGETRFFEAKDRAARRGQGRPRKFDNRVRFALRMPIGGAVVFDHLLLHEGAEVTSGLKYAVRTDLVHAVR